MNLEDALNLLSQVTGAVQTDRRSHGQIQIALASLQKLIEDHKSLTKQKPKDDKEVPESSESETKVD